MFTSKEEGDYWNKEQEEEETDKNVDCNMFSLLFGLFEYLFSTSNYFILILGLDNSGKTTFLEQARCKLNKNYKKIDLTRIASTVGLNVGKVETCGVILNFWDLGGQKELQLLWDKYFLDAHAIIWLVDSSDPSRLSESIEAFNSIIKNDLLKHLPLLFVLNKQDIPDAMKPSEITHAFRSSLDKLGDRRFLSIPTSALKGTGVRESINWIGEQVKLSSKPPADSHR